MAFDAAATTQRTFVSSHGLDSNPCNLVSPCRSFGVAIAQTTAGGEIVVLDSAGYGSVTITQSVSIAAPPGIYAGISVFGGTGVTVNAGVGNKVTLRGLTINGLGGTTGIAFQSGAALYLDKVVVSGFAGGGGAGLSAAIGTATASLFIRESAFRDNATGLKTGTTSGTLTLDIERTMFERNAIGADVQGTTSGTIRASTFSAGTTGISLGLIASNQPVKLDLRNCTITDNGGTGIVAMAAMSPSTVTVVSTLISGNGSGLQISGNGNLAYASDSTFIRNGTGINAISSGTIVSGGDNRLLYNLIDGSFTSTGNFPPVVNAGSNINLILPSMAALNGTVSDDGLPNPPGTLTTIWSLINGPGPVVFGNTALPSTTASFSVTGTYILRLTAGDGQLSTTSDVTVTVQGIGPVLPPDPAAVAPPLDTTVATTVGQSTAFLYTGANPIQTGVAPGTIDPIRAGAVRGKVMLRDGSALSGVAISIVGHPEFGQTLSRADGMFDLVVNGGGVLNVRYDKPGYLAAQRQLNVPWQDFKIAPDVALIPLEPQVTNIDLSSPTPIQVARGSPVTDSDGTRQATLLFPAGTTATMVMPDNSAVPLTHLTVRATEFTVGPNGPKSMPAELPPASVYTYAVELGADEAIVAGAKSITFNQPLIQYVENFLGFPVGTVVPAGSYDRDKSLWVPSDNGRVIKILSIIGGLANVDSVGAGSLPPLVLSAAERQQLAILYSVGQELWRVPIPHLTPYDYNWAGFCDSGLGFAVICEIPKLLEALAELLLSDPCTQNSASTIECQNQILGEAVRLTGTPFSLHYQSERVPGRTSSASLDIPLSGATLQPGVLRIDLIVEIAGQQIEQSFPAVPNQHTTFTWNGSDVYGRTLQGAQPVKVGVCYVYGESYGIPPSFGSPPTYSVVIDTRGGERGLCQITNTTVTTWDGRGQGLGGWSLSPHHVYDPTGQVLYLGNGQRRSTDTLSPIITTVAGGGPGGEVDGIPATQATLDPSLTDIAVGPDGSLYFVQINIGVRRVGPDGIINTIANFPGCCAPGIALAPDGSIYVTTGVPQVHRIAPGGGITTVAGNGQEGSAGDGGPATAAQLEAVTGLAVGLDGSLYIDQGANNIRIRRVDPAGIITTVPGTDQAQNQANRIAIGPDGSLYLAGGCCPVSGPIGGVRRVGPDGIISRVAGGGNPVDQLGDGLPATEAEVLLPVSVAVRADGGFYIRQAISTRIRFVGPDGIISTVAGNGTAGFSGDGGPATRAQISSSGGIAVGPDRSLYIADPNAGRVRRVAPALPGLTVGEFLVPAEDGSEVYLFTGFGRHVRTLDALTGAVRYEFAYDSANRLIAVTDPFGNVTTIERDGSGNPVAVVAPFGQRTTMTLDANGYLASVTNPATESVQASYTIGGLLSTFTDPKGNLSHYNYDSLGRLAQAQDAAGGSKTLTRSSITNGHVVTLTTALGRTTTYQVERLPIGDQRRLNTFPDGTQTELVIRQDGTRTTRFADGMVHTLVQGPDPRFGMKAPIPSSVAMSTPGGLTFTSTTQRAVTLANPNDPLTLQSLTDTVVVNGRTFTSAYSGSTRTLTGTTAEGRTRTLTLDAFGRVAQAGIAGLLPSTYSYDARGRLAGVTQGTGPDTRTATFTYNAEGYLDVITDPLGRTGLLAYDAAGRVIQQTLADGRVIPFTYDAKGNLTTVTPPGRPAHAFAYTQVDLESTYTPPDVGAGTNQTLYAYNTDRQLTRTTRPDSQLVDLGYDAAGRLDTLGFSRGNVAYGYDATTGHLSSINAPGGLSLAFGYDGALLGSTTSAGAIAGNVGRTYDNDFRVVSQSVNGGNTVGFSFDLDSLLSQAGSLTLARDAQNGLLTGTTLGNVTDTLGYNGFGEPTSYSASFSSSPLYTVQHTRDALGRLTGKTETIGGVIDVFAYSYDLAGRLAQVTKNSTITATYTYDGNGNRLSGPGLGTPPTYDNQDRLTQYGINTYTYTANGELSTKSVGGPITTYQYDELGNLIHVSLPGGTQVDYVIDGQNRRIGKKVNATLVQGFLYSGRLRVIAELDGSNNIISRFVYSGSGNVPAYMIKSGVTYRFITDHLGSPRLVVDSTTGAVAQRIDYDEFGNVMNDTNSGFQPFGFAGGLYDTDTKLVRFGARDYDAETGRWLAKDPILFSGGDTNLYAYALGNAVNLRDPRGLQTGYSDMLITGSGTVEIPHVEQISQTEAAEREFAAKFDQPIGPPWWTVPGIFAAALPAGLLWDLEFRAIWVSGVGGVGTSTIPSLVCGGGFATTGALLVAQTPEAVARYAEFVMQQIALRGGEVTMDVLDVIHAMGVAKFGEPMYFIQSLEGPTGL